MIKLFLNGTYLVNGRDIVENNSEAATTLKQKYGKENLVDARRGTISHGILTNHNTVDDGDKMRIKFDAMASHDITYVGIVQTARASGLTEFPIPYVLTNCHNSLCAVGGTINEDDHIFGLSAAKKYGGIFVPPHQAVIHQYMREMMSGCGKMILGSDSHTRYGALGTMAIGEGGPELVKQLLCRTYDITRPEVVAVYLTGTPNKGVGPQDVALSIIGKVFESGFVKNKIMEFVGDGIANLDVEYRNGIDVMTTETTCLSSIWVTDNKVKDYYTMHGRTDAYEELNPADLAYYDGMIYVDLSTIEPMIAMPFHPSNVYTIRELNSNLEDILARVEMIGNMQLGNSNVTLKLRDKIKNGFLQVEQGVIGGCAGGTFDNICDAADILNGKYIGVDEFSLSVYPSSQPTYFSLVENGSIAKLMASGATIRTAFCGPCFGAGDVPPNNGLSIRHATRNFPNREGSKPSDGQIASVALMDARSIAATAANKGQLISATDIDLNFTKPKYYFNKEIYANRCYDGVGKPDLEAELKFGPNITDWPGMSRLTNDLLLQVVSYISDPVTTTDELIPSGETSSYRSNPLRLAEFTLSRKDPAYVGKAKKIHKVEQDRLDGINPVDSDAQMESLFAKIRTLPDCESVEAQNTGIGSVVYAVKPGDGSAREQAASCQKVLGTWANIATEYATKRYRSNLINWGMLPFILTEETPFKNGDFIFVQNIKDAVSTAQETITAYVIGDTITKFELTLKDLTDDERKIILAGCLMNFYSN